MRMKSKKLYLEVVGIMLIISLIIGISYSYYYANVKDVNKTETHLKAQAMGLTYTGETEINCGSMVPGNTCVKTFKVENTSDVKVYYNIYMENITNEFNEDLVYTLTDDEGTVVSETVLPKTKTGKEYLKKSIVIDASPAVKNYTLTIKYKYTEENQNEYQGASFRATVGIDAEQTGDLYKLTGTVVKLLDGGETETVTSGNLVFFSEKQDIEIQSDGTFEATDLEVGNHEVYYMGDIDASAMNKDEVRANALCKMTTFNILTTTKVTLTCKDGVDPVGLKDIVPTPQSSSNKLICKRATELHTEICNQTSDYCVGAGYTTGSTIRYGNETIISGELNSGDAFDCDVNGDGTFDSETERFYYLSDYYNTTTKNFESDTAVLIYYNNTKEGLPDNTETSGIAYNISGSNLLGPETAKNQLPLISQWKNVSLKNATRAILSQKLSNEVESNILPTAYNYSAYAARLPIYKEITEACGESCDGLYRLKNCEYLLENTNYTDSSIKSYGYWLDTPYDFSSSQVLRIDSIFADIYTNNANSQGIAEGYYGYGVRPIIEVSKSNMEI